MPSTEFLLYLVIVIFAVFLIMQYYKEDSFIYSEARSNNFFEEDKPQRQPSSDTSSVASSQPSMGMSQPLMGMGGMNQPPMGQQPMGMGQNRCQNPRCRQSGRCNCPKSNIHVNINNDEGPNGIGGPYPLIDPLRKFDYDAVYDDFTPPFRRSYYDDYPLVPGLYPAYTRGPPGRFRKVGMLIADGVAADDKYKFLNLMGREKYTNGGFEYYASSIDTDTRLKIYIETKEKQINCGDIVRIPELSGYTFTFKEDIDLSPKYDPYYIY
jgi:hypothetical protein